MKILIILFTVIATTSCRNIDVNKYQEFGIQVGDLKIIRTQGGIPHIYGKDHYHLGLGYGYAFAKDNHCTLLEDIVKLRGEGALHLSKILRARNIDPIKSDAFYRAIDIIAKGQRDFNGELEHLKELVTGYVAGFNRVVAQVKRGSLDSRCADKPWFGTITPAELMARYIDAAMLSSMQNAINLLHIDGAIPVAPNVRSLSPRSSLRWDRDHPPYGSNGWAFGRELTVNKRGLLIGNPHFPWQGVNRFYEVHLKIPGKLDVMGASLYGFPLVNIGFNKDIAWTHTVSAAIKMAIYRHKISVDGKKYEQNGKLIPIKKIPVEIPISKDGEVVYVKRNLYWTAYGPIISYRDKSGLINLTSFNEGYIYAVKDPHINNSRFLKQWYQFSKARTTLELSHAIGEFQGLGFVNTIAADRYGNAFYADSSITPYLTSDKIAQCMINPIGKILASQKILLLKGGDPDCEWQNSRYGNITPFEEAPKVTRGDYLFNANDSYWYANHEFRFANNISDVYGQKTLQPQPISLRTYSNLKVLADNSTSTIDLPRAKELILENRHHAGELYRDKVIETCGDSGIKEAELKKACDILKGWDLKADKSSQGVHIFREFLVKAYDMAKSKMQNLYSFSSSDQPLEAPSLTLSNTEIITALREAIKTLKNHQIPLDATLGEVQFVVNGVKKIAIHGGSSNEGLINAIWTSLNPAGSRYKIFGGTSFLLAVTFDQRGPVADAILTYSQSDNPQNAHAFDQTLLFSDKKWLKLPFHDEDVMKNQISMLDFL